LNAILIASILIGISLGFPLFWKFKPEINREEVLCRTGLRVLNEEEKSLMALKLTRAGIDSSPEYYYGMKVVLTAGYLILLAVVSILFSLSFVVFLVLLCGAAITWLYPNIKINNAITTRQSEIRRKLDDFATYLSTALNSMPSVESALYEAGNATGGVFREEIETVMMENASGKSLPDALNDWAYRVDVTEISTLVSAINQIHQKGAPASEKMKEYADQIRMTKRYELMEASGKLSVQLIFVVAFFMLIPLLLTIGYPSVVSLLNAL